MKSEMQEKTTTSRPVLKKTSSIAIATIFIWIGFICSISFMEAWLKFKAPNVTLALGLGIGKVIFSTLNKMEWLFAITTYLTLSPKTYRLQSLFFSIVTILLIQTTYLLPALNNRADLIIAGQIAQSSKIHIYYILLEILKTTLLFFLGFISLNQRFKSPKLD